MFHSPRWQPWIFLVLYVIKTNIIKYWLGWKAIHQMYWLNSWKYFISLFNGVTWYNSFFISSHDKLFHWSLYFPSTLTYEYWAGNVRRQDWQGELSRGGELSGWNVLEPYYISLIWSTGTARNAGCLSVESICNVSRDNISGCLSIESIYNVSRDN